jgi:diadenosine tetraphosphate (Ap4A) HIT family hydrolase
MASGFTSPACERAERLEEPPSTDFGSNASMSADAATAPDCLICREQDGRVEVPGGFLIDDRLIVAFHCPPLSASDSISLGYLFVTPRRHVPSFAELDAEEAAEVGQAISRLSAALKAENVERVYVMTIGHGWPHLHVHLVPRWPGTPPEITWTDVVTGDGARRGDAANAARFVEKLRSHLRS